MNKAPQIEQELAFPPVSYEQLRLITRRIKTGNLDLPIGKKSFAALTNMVDSPEKVAISNIVELSECLNVSPALLTRLAKLLGFCGFNAFQNIFKQVNSEPSHFYSEKLDQLFTSRGTNTREFLHQQAHNLSAELENAVQQINTSAFEEAASLLISRKRVYLFGFRQPASIASMLRYGLTLLRSNVHMFSQADHGVALSMSQLRPEDLLVLISSAPYSELTIKICSLAKKRHSKVIAITDSHDSPLAEKADVCLIIPSVNHFYVNSLVLHTFFVENLLNTAAAMLGKGAMDNIRHYEQLLQDFQVNTP